MEGYVTMDQIAERLGVKLPTVRQYHSRGDLPPADERVGRTPVWREETIKQWLDERPGHGWRKGKSHSEETAD